MEQLKVTKQSSKILAILLLLIFVHGTTAASTKPASVLLQEGLYAEEIEGNLDEAIKIYLDVIKASQQMEQSAAQATYRIGLCYIKKGDTEKATQQFKELISKYPKQAAIVQEANKQIEKLMPSREDATDTQAQAVTPDLDKSGMALLDEETRTQIEHFEQSFAPYFKHETRYELANSQEKNNIIQEWEREALGDDFNRRVAAIAALNNVKAKEAVDVLIKIAEEPMGNNRPKWMAVRGLAQIKDMKAVPTLIGLVNHGNTNVRVYTRLALANITGVYFKDDENAWKNWWIEKGQPEYKEAISAKKPVVISIKPENYSNKVSPDTTEISVTFNKEMMDRSWSWVRWNYPFPETKGNASYDNTKTTCTLPVKLEPGKAYLIRINSPSHMNFRSADGSNAQPFVLVFSTLDKNNKPTPIPEEMIAFAKQINSNVQEKPYTQESHSDITPDGMINCKSLMIQKNSGSSPMTKFNFMSSDFARVTAMQDNKGRPLEFSTTHDGNIFLYDVTLNEPVNPGEIFTYSSEGTMTGMIKPITGKENTFSFHLAHSPNVGIPTLRIETYLLPEGAKLVSTNPADMQRTEKDGRIELRNEKLIPVGGGIITEFQYKLEK